MAIRIARLRRRSEFLRVAAARRNWVTPGLILQAAERPRCFAAESGFRVGFTASRKVGMAVDRNRARRRLRAAVAKAMPGRAQDGLDYVVVARKQTLSRPFAELVGDLETALDRTACLREAGASLRRRQAAGRRRGRGAAS